jgi:hypothetical protein
MSLLGSTQGCVGCGASLFERNTLLTYHRGDDPEPDLQSGYLCSLCKQQIEAVLDLGYPAECKWCSAPLPEAERRQIMEYDEHDALVDVVTICSNCLHERY